MAKDTQDKDTHDAFTTFEQLERETFIGNALATGGHYQAVKPDKFYQVTGNRYAGSKTRISSATSGQPIAALLLTWRSVTGHTTWTPPLRKATPSARSFTTKRQIA